MSEDSSRSNAAPAKRRLGFWLGVGVGGLAGLMVIAYLIVTSSAFLKSFVLPKAGAVLAAKVTADSISASPLMGSLTIRGFSLQPEGAEPLLSAQEVSAHFSLFGILGGKYEIHEVNLVAPVVNWVKSDDGKNDNLNALLNGMAKNQGTKAAAVKTAPFQISLNQIAIQRGTVRYVTQGASGSDQAEISGLNLTIDKFQNSQPGKLVVEAAVKYEIRNRTNATPSLLQGKLAGNYTYRVGADLIPEAVSGSTKVEVTQAQGAWADGANLAATLDCSLTPNNVEKLNLRFEKAGAALGQLNLSGPFDRTKNEGRLKLELLSINRQILNLAGAAAGLDFAQTTLDATNMLDVTQGGNIVSLSGNWRGGQLTLLQNRQTTPAINADFSYQVNLDFKAQSLIVQRLGLASTIAGRDFLSAKLDRAMNLNWGQKQAGFQEASLVLSLTNLNLKDWSVFAGTNTPSGTLAVAGKVTAQKDGKVLLADLGLYARDFAVTVGTNRLAFASLQSQLKGRMEDYRKFVLESYTFEARESAPVATISASGSGDYSLSTTNGNLRLVLEGNLAALLAQYPVAQIHCSSGLVKLNLLLAQKYPPLQKMVSGSVSIDGFTGDCAGYRLTNYTAQVECEVDAKEDSIHLNGLKITAKDSFNSGGSLGLSGVYDLSKKTAQFTFNTIDLNQYAAGPFLAPLLSSMPVPRFSLSSEGSVAYDPAGKTAIKADLKMGGLTFADPAKKLPATPLNFEWVLDAAMGQSNAVDISQCLLKLGPEQGGVRSGGVVALSGNLDLKTLAARLAYGVTNVNEKGLAAWVENYLAPKKLASVSINGFGNVDYSPDKDSQFKSSLSVTNLLVAETAASGTNSGTPLNITLKWDASIKAKLLELRQFLVALNPTTLGSNEFQVTGKLDLSASNAYSGQLVAQADSLDLTPYWRMLAKTNATTTSTAATAAKPAAASKNVKTTTAAPTEPAAITLPFQNFSADLKVGRLYLEDIALSNLVATTKLNGGNAQINPFGFNLNGTPVKATAALNLGVVGYTYDLAMQTTNMPVEPLANTFVAGANGKYQGNVTLDAQIKGAGITDPSIQSNLAAQISFTLTNANIVLVSAWSKSLLTPILTVLRLPELLNSPVNGMVAQAKAGPGIVTLQSLTVYTPSFQATSQGTITLASVLTNSTLALPVDIALERSVAQKANLVPSSTPTNATFVTLPSFVQVKGTLGSPKPEISKLELAKMSLQSVAGLPAFAGSKVLTNITSILSGTTSTTNAITTAAGTNATATKVLNILDALAATNAVSAVSNSPAGSNTNVNKALNILNIFRKGR
jgi:hypothetical protein